MGFYTMESGRIMPEMDGGFWKISKQGIDMLDNGNKIENVGMGAKVTSQWFMKAIFWATKKKDSEY